MNSGRWLVFVFATAIASAALPDSVGDLSLADGRVLKGATIVAVSPLKVTVRYADGLASIEKSKLPEELRARYPEDFDAASKQLDLDAKRAALADRARRQEQMRLDQERHRRAEAAQSHAAVAARAEAMADREMSRAIQLAESAAERYFRERWSQGNNSTYNLRVRAKVDECEPKPGWPGRWTAKGSAWVQSYVSSGDAFTSTNQAFEVEIDFTKAIPRAEVTPRG